MYLLTIPQPDLLGWARGQSWYTAGTHYVELDGSQEHTKAGRIPAPHPLQPCLCPQIYQSLLLRGLSLVGWYHSHPHSPALPSLQDIDTQMDYQLRLQGSSNGFQPCLALLCCKCPTGVCVRVTPGP